MSAAPAPTPISASEIVVFATPFAAFTVCYDAAGQPVSVRREQTAAGAFVESLVLRAAWAVVRIVRPGSHR